MQRAIEQSHLCWCRAFLRAKHFGSTLWPAQHIVHVRSERHFHPVGRFTTMSFDQHDSLDIGARQWLGHRNRFAVFQNDRVTARLRAADAAVDGRAAAEADDDVLHAHLDGDADEFARAEGRRRHWIAIDVRHQSQTACRGHLNHRRLAVAEQSEAGIHLHFRQRSGHDSADEASTSRLNQCRDRPFPAVGHGTMSQFNV